MNVQITKFPEISHFSNDSPLGRYVNATLRKSSEIQAQSYHKTKKICMNIGFQLLSYIMKIKSQEDQ